MKHNIFLMVFFAALFIVVMEVSAVSNDIYNIEVTTIDGEPTTLASYKGKTLLIVNTASKCGFTKQYAALQELYDEYKDRGLIILGFPSNDFLWQEPKSNQEIKAFCSLTFGVTFPMFEKIHVKGRKQHPLYAYLTSEATNPDYAGAITWNFNKFLIGPDGRIVNRFGSKTTPKDPAVLDAINALCPPASNGASD